MARITFDRSYPLIIVNLRVGSTTDNEFHDLIVGLDTGASTTAIPTKVALDLGYDLANPKEERLVVTASGARTEKVITVRQLTALGETVEDMDVLCLNLPEPSIIEGVLGLNFLEHFDIEISFSTGTIVARCP